MRVLCCRPAPHSRLRSLDGRARRNRRTEKTPSFVAREPVECWQGTRSASSTGALTASKKVVPRFQPDDVVELARRRRWNPGGVGAAMDEVADTHSAASRSPAWQSVEAPGVGRLRRRWRLHLLLLLAGISRTDGVAARLLRRQSLPLGDPFRCTGRTGC